MLNDIDIKIRLHTLKRHDRNEGWENDRPYMWNIFFKIDGSCITITDAFRLKGKATFFFGPGSHGNLGISSLHGKDNIRIAAKASYWETRLVPLKIPYFEAKTSATAGLISILMEKNNVSLKGAEAGHQALNHYVENKINGLIANFDPRKVDIHDIENSIYDYFEHRSAQYAVEVEEAVGNAVKNKQSIFQNIWSLVNSDNMIGYEIWKFSHDELIKNKGHVSFSKRWTDEKLGDWEVFGEVNAMDLQT